jgi:DNA primase
MSSAGGNAFQPRISRLEYLELRGWRPVRDSGRDEVAGLCPLHRESRPSFYLNRRKQVFYCHGCGRGGGLTRLVHLLGDLPEPVAEPAPEHLLEHAHRLYERQLARFGDAQAYLARRGIRDRAVIERVRMGYAPGACLRGYLERLGYGRQSLRDRGLVDDRGRDGFFRCLTFPLEQVSTAGLPPWPFPA